MNGIRAKKSSLSTWLAALLVADSAFGTGSLNNRCFFPDWVYVARTGVLGQVQAEPYQLARKAGLSDTAGGIGGDGIAPEVVIEGDVFIEDDHDVLDIRQTRRGALRFAPDDNSYFRKGCECPRKIVIPRACDFFDLSRFSYPTRCFSVPSTKSSS
jgi:hypothetical protein